MATTLSIPYVFTPFTKIRSAEVNTNFSTIANRLNWSGGTDATTGLGDDNLQSNTASGGGLTRSSKLKAGTVNAVVINDATGKMSEVASVANTTVYFNALGVPTAGPLPAAAGGLGASLVPTTPDDVIKVNAAGNAFELGASPVPPPIKIYSFYRFV